MTLFKPLPTPDQKRREPNQREKQPVYHKFASISLLCSVFLSVIRGPGINSLVAPLPLPVYFIVLILFLFRNLFGQFLVTENKVI